MSGFDEVARAFVAHFYQTLDSNPAALAGLYQPTSVVTFDGTMHTGPDAIIGKLVVRFRSIPAVRSLVNP